jgi:predicted nucleic acid-binding protein
MILVDTSVWVDHFRRASPQLMDLLGQGLVGTHPFVIGELACGNLHNRSFTLTQLAKLPRAPLAKEPEAHYLLDSGRLWGKGLGWIDVHLIVSAKLARWSLWSADRALREAAARAGVPTAP